MVNLAGRRRDRWGGLPGRVEVQVRVRVPLQEPDEDLGHDPAAHRPEPLTFVRRQFHLVQDVEPQRCLADPSRWLPSPSAALDKTGGADRLASCSPTVDRLRPAPPSALRVTAPLAQLPSSSISFTFTVVRPRRSSVGISGFCSDR